MVDWIGFDKYDCVMVGDNYMMDILVVINFGIDFLLVYIGVFIFELVV